MSKTDAALLDEIDRVAKETTPTAALVAVGGAHAVAAVVEEFYERLLDDPAVSPYFAAILERGGLPGLKRHQVLLLVKVLGGPDRYEGRELEEAHDGLGITDEAYRRVSLYLLLTLHDNRVPVDILCAVDEVLRGVHPLVVSDPDGDQQ